MKVWVDQEQCTGDGSCEERCPSVFAMQEGLSFVRSSGAGPAFVGGPADQVDVPASLLDAVLDATEDCPGECIYLEP